MGKPLLHKFVDDARASSTDPNKPPNSISAKALDGNFAACQPLQNTGTNAPYTVRQTPDGWQLEPAVEFLVCENGQPRRFRFFAQRVGATS